MTTDTLSSHPAGRVPRAHNWWHSFIPLRQETVMVSSGRIELRGTYCRLCESYIGPIIAVRFRRLELEKP